MSSRLLHFAPLLFLLAGNPAPASPTPMNLPLAPGEKLTYRVSWGPFDKAASVEISASAEMRDGVALTRITTRGGSTGAVRVLLAFDGVSEALYETATGRLLSITNETTTGKKTARTTLLADHEKSTAVHTNPARPKPKPQTKTLAFAPDEPLLDFITAFIHARANPLEPGQTRALSAIFDDDLYALSITAFQKQIITTPAGPRQCLLLQPFQRGKASGMFKRGGQIKVWIADDASRVPLRFEIKLKYGTATGVLLAQEAARAPKS